MALSGDATLRVPRWVVGSFLAYHLLGMAILSLPESVIKRRLLPLACYYCEYFGLWQSWAMYSPDPPRENLILRTRVHLADGAVRPFDFPEWQHGIFASFFSLGFRSLLTLGPAYPDALADIARYVARKSARAGGAHPRRVDLFWEAQAVPPPEIGLRTPLLPATRDLPIGSYPISEGAL